MARAKGVVRALTEQLQEQLKVEACGDYARWSENPVNPDHSDSRDGEGVEKTSLRDYRYRMEKRALVEIGKKAVASTTPTRRLVNNRRLKTEEVLLQHNDGTLAAQYERNMVQWEAEKNLPWPLYRRSGK